MIDHDRANRLADVLSSHPAATHEDHEEAAYLRYSYPHDCRYGGPIGPQAAGAYLDCTQARIDRLDRLEHQRVQVEAAKSMAAQGYPVTCQGVHYS